MKQLKIKTLNTFNYASLRIDQLRKQLTNHNLYCTIDSEEKLRIFMEHHVYAVWDFMSLIKALQSHFAPITLPWTPPATSRHANFINQLVLEEESDFALAETSDSTHASHFESYLIAMEEIGADTQAISTFVHTICDKGLDVALKLPCVPNPALEFMQFTFDLVERNKPHLLTAALAYGREDLVPQLFRSLQKELHINSQVAPNLYAYLKRHIQLDSEEHGPLALQLLSELCEGSDQMHVDAVIVAEQALAARLDFWDGIQSAILH